MKRFYKTADVVAWEGGGWQVRLDGRPLKTPAKTELILQSRALADAIAAEWAGQGDEIQPGSMPMMQLVATALDRTDKNRAYVAAEIARYGETDLIACRATEPAELVARQEAVWQPKLDWFRHRYDLEIRVMRGVIAVQQAPELRPRLETIARSLDVYRLTALHQAVSITGSVVLGLGLLEAAIEPEEAFLAGQLDELYQAERWGDDAEAEERRLAIRSELISLKKFLELIYV